MTRAWRFETRVLWLAFLTGLPGTAVALFLLWTQGFTPRVVWTFTLLVVCFWWGFGFALRERVVRPLQTLSNLPLRRPRRSRPRRSRSVEPSPARRYLMDVTFGEVALDTNHTSVFTADDVLELPLPNGVIGYEFVDGEPVEVMPASPIHGELIVEVAYRLRSYVEQAGLKGKVYSDSGFVLGLRRDRERMRGPDVAYVNRRKIEAHADPERLFRCAPDLAIEIDLTSAKKPGGRQRIAEYLEAGVRLVWAIDPHTRSATIHRPDGSVEAVREHEMLDGEDVLPGLRLRLRDLFSARASQ